MISHIHSPISAISLRLSELPCTRLPIHHRVQLPQSFHRRTIDHGSSSPSWPHTSRSRLSLRNGNRDRSSTAKARKPRSVNGAFTPPPLLNPSPQSLDYSSRTPPNKRLGTNTRPPTTPSLTSPSLARPPPKTPTQSQHPPTTLAAPLLPRTHPQTRDRDFTRGILSSTTSPISTHYARLSHRQHIPALPSLLHG